MKGIESPEYQTFKEETLQAFADLKADSQEFENILISTLGYYESRSFVRPTAVVDSTWTRVGDVPSDSVAIVPAAIAVSVRVQNLSDVALDDLRLALNYENIEGLSLDQNQNSTIPVSLGPDDMIAGGNDEFVGTWNFTYVGDLTNQKHLVFTATLLSDTIAVQADGTEIVVLDCLAPDSDEDGAPDHYEIAYGFDPNSDDSQKDADNDGLTNLQEYLLRTIPINPDNDGDGIADGVEFQQGSDPWDPFSPVGTGTVAAALPLNVTAIVGDTLYIPITISAGSPVTFVQFTLSYDSTQLKFENVDLDPGLLGFTLNEVNTKPGFLPETPGTNKNVLVKLSSLNSSFTGKGIPVAKLGFSVISGMDTSTTVAFDRNPDHTLLKDQDNFNLNIVSFTDAIIASSIENPEPPVPKEFVLEQNYPNPFNASTTIKYQLPKEVEVKLTIYNILGQRVRNLLDKKQNAGFYAIEWDGKNKVNSKVATGVYFYKLRAGDFVQTKKMLLLK